jgi:peptidyl-prolyl cis-trans isomerase D
MRDSFQHLKWILLAIVAAFIFGFVFLDMGLGGALAGKKDTSAFAARVNGETITKTDYYRMMKNLEDMYRQMLGGQFNSQMAAAYRLPSQAMDTLIDQRLLAQEAKRLNLDATPEEVRKKLLTYPMFNEGGRFIGLELYSNYVTGQMGYASTAEFESDVARDISVQKMESAMTSSIVISPKAADAEYKRITENAKIRYVLLPALQLASTVTVTQPEIDTYYRNNTVKYTHAEQREVQYLLADYAKLRNQLQPTDADLRKQYEQNKDQFRSPEAAHALHILVKVDPKAPPAVDAAAKAKAESLVKQLRAGADWAVLAQANSDDPGSSGKGGDMDWLNRGATVPSFDTALFSLPLNTISDPVRSPEYGYHIIKVLERRPAGLRSFEEVRGERAAPTANEMAKAAAESEMTRIAAIMNAKPPKSTEEFAAFANDKVTSNDTQWIQKADPIPSLGAHQPMQEWIFSAKPRDVSPVIGTPRGPVIAFLKGIRPSGVTALAEIRAKVEEDVRLSKAAEAARTTLAQVMAGATSVDQVAQKTGLAPQETTVTREGTSTGITGNITPIVEGAIAANVGQMKGPVVVKEGAVAFQVVDQHKVTAKDLADNRGQFLNQLRQTQARSLKSALIRRLRQESNIVVNEELLAPPAPQPQQAGM